MKALFVTEIRRITSRRLFHVLTMLGVAAFLVAGVIILTTSDTGFAFFEVEDVLLGLSVPMLALAWLFGASAVGAEWPHRTITTLLTWEPRRIRVFFAKLIVAALAAALWLAFLCLFLSLVLGIVANLRGNFIGVDQDYWALLARRILKISAGGGIVAALGMSLAMIGKNTAAALGAGFAYLAIVERVIGGFKPSWSDWLLGDNLALFLAGNSEVSHLGHTSTGALLVLLGYVSVIALVSAGMFGRREIG